MFMLIFKRMILNIYNISFSKIGIILCVLSCVSWLRLYACLQVEFEWLRQYWFQGQRYTRFCSWWTKPMEQLEKDWKLMEMMVSFTWHVEKLVDRSLNNSSVSNNTVIIHRFKAFFSAGNSICFSSFKTDSYYCLFCIISWYYFSTQSHIHKSLKSKSLNT